MRLKAYLARIASTPRNAVLYLVVWFVAHFCFTGVVTVLLNLYLLRLGYGPDFIGITHGTMGLAFAVCALPAGVVGLVLGLRKSIVAALIGIVAVTPFLPCSVFFTGIAQQILIVAAHGLYGVFLTSINVNGVAYLAGSVEEGQRSFVFSLFVAIGPIGGFSGSLVAGFMPGAISRLLAIGIERPEPYGFSLALAPILFAVALLVFLRSGEVTVAAQTASSRRSQMPVLLMVVMLLAAFLRGTMSMGMLTYLNAYWDSVYHFPTRSIGLVMSAGRLAGIPAALAAPFVISAIGSRRASALTWLVGILLMLPVSLLTGVGPGVVSFIGLLAVMAAHEAAFTTFHQQIAAPAWRALMSGAVFTAMGASFGATAFLGGKVVMTMGYPAFFLITTAVSAAGVLLFWAYFALWKPKHS